MWGGVISGLIKAPIWAGKEGLLDRNVVRGEQARFCVAPASSSLHSMPTLPVRCHGTLAVVGTALRLLKLSLTPFHPSLPPPSPPQQQICSAPELRPTLRASSTSHPKPMMEEFKAEVDEEKGYNGNGKDSLTATTPQEVMPKPYFATIDQVLAYYNVRIKGREGGREVRAGRGLEEKTVGWCGRVFAWIDCSHPSLHPRWFDTVEVAWPLLRNVVKGPPPSHISLCSILTSPISLPPLARFGSRPVSFLSTPSSFPPSLPPSLPLSPLFPSPPSRPVSLAPMWKSAALSSDATP